MPIRPFSRILIVALGVFSSSIAFARNPPALVKQQQASAHATQAGGGYRDVNYRFGIVAARTPEVMRAAGGYRDINHRFPNASRLAPVRTATNQGPARWR